MEIPQELKEKHIQLARQFEIYQNSVQGHSFGDYMPKHLDRIGNLKFPLGQCFEPSTTLDQLLIHHAKRAFSYLIFDVVQLYKSTPMNIVKDRSEDAKVDRYSPEFVKILETVAIDYILYPKPGSTIFNLEDVASYFLRLHFTLDRALDEFKQLSNPSINSNPAADFYAKMIPVFKFNYFTSGAEGWNYSSVYEFQELFKSIVSGRIEDPYKEPPVLHCEDCSRHMIEADIHPSKK